MKYSVMAESELDARGTKKSYDIFANHHTIGRGMKSELHTHSYYEVLTVNEGTLACRVPDLPTVILRVGDVIFFPPHSVHATALPSETQEMRSTVVKFSPLFLYPMETTRSDVDCLLMAPRFDAPYYLFRREETKTAAFADLLCGILQEHTARQAGFELALRGALISLYVNLVRSCGKLQSSNGGEIDRGSAQRLHAALRYLAENYPYSISMADAAAACRMDYYQFSRFFKRLTGKSFCAYLLEMRLDAAQKMLLRGDASISEIAPACGFEYVAYFIQKFKARFGMTPREYQRLYRHE